jgi:mRNA-degrading endonuclease RelE of RelBE toxin-antitoxin system
MLTADYIVGLTDGEGSFSVYLHPPRKKRSVYTPYYRVEWHYYIKLKEDDLSLLKKVQKFFGCGHVYFQKERRKNHKNCYRFEVSSYRDITNVIIPFFKKHRPECPCRRDDFRILCRIHRIISNKNKIHLAEGDVKGIRKLKMQMHV